jgi:hypothetical protein
LAKQFVLAKNQDYAVSGSAPIVPYASKPEVEAFSGDAGFATNRGQSSRAAATRPT